MKLLTVFTTGVNSVFPIVLLILFGFLLRRSGFLTDNFVKVGNKLVFRYLLPAKLFLNAYKIESFSDIPWRLVFYCMLMLLVIFLLGCVTAPAATEDPKRKGVLLQSTFRSNNAILGISLAGILGGDPAVAVSAILTALCIPVMNTLAVLALSLYVHGDGEGVKLKNVLLNVLKNPLIIGIALGLACLPVRGLEQRLFGRVVFSLSGSLGFFYTAVSQAASIATPFSLIVLGGQFSFEAAGNMRWEIVVGTVWRVVIAPVLALGGAYLLSRYTGLLTCTAVEYPALIALFATPTAVSSAVMAGQMGNDEQLATQIVVWSSIASIATMFATICILMWAGCLA